MGFENWTKQEQYQYRKAQYSPGTMVAVPTHEAFGGESGVFAAGLVHTCNWLGIVQVYLTDRWVCSVDEVEQIDRSEIVEGWFTGDALLLAHVIETGSTMEGYRREDWPVLYGDPFSGQRGPYSCWLKPRRLKPMSDVFDPTAGGAAVNLFMGSPVYCLVVRASERLAGGPIEPWPIVGQSPRVQGFPIQQAW